MWLFCTWCLMLDFFAEIPFGARSYTLCWRVSGSRRGSLVRLSRTLFIWLTMRDALYLLRGIWMMPSKSLASIRLTQQDRKPIEQPTQSAQKANVEWWPSIRQLVVILDELWRSCDPVGGRSIAGQKPYYEFIGLPIIMLKAIQIHMVFEHDDRDPGSLWLHMSDAFYFG